MLTISGDITKETIAGYTTVICHQTNCITVHSKGLARSIFDAYPEVNIYENGTTRTVGTYIEAHTKDGKIIIHLNGQHTQGAPSPSETREQRLEWMKKILEDMAVVYSEHKSDYAFLFPKLLGCGLAGGNWDDYQLLLEDFESKGFKVVIVDFNK